MNYIDNQKKYFSYSGDNNVSTLIALDHLSTFKWRNFSSARLQIDQYLIPLLAVFNFSPV